MAVYIGGTIKVRHTVRNAEGVLFNPVSVNCIINDENGTQKANGAMTNDDVGIYTFTYTTIGTDYAGVWKVITEDIDTDSNHKITVTEFEVRNI